MSRLLSKIFLALLGLVMLAVLLGALAVYTVWATLRWLLTGRKPQVVLVWQQFSALRKGARWGGQPGAQSGAPSGFQTPRQEDIVDVEVREVLDDAPRLPPRQQG